MFAAVYDGGSAPRTGEPSSEEQVRGLLDTILANFEESLTWMTENVIDPGGISIPIPQIPSHLAISAITLAFLAWLFVHGFRACCTSSWWFGSSYVLVDSTTHCYPLHVYGIVYSTILSPSYTEKSINLGTS